MAPESSEPAAAAASAPEPAARTGAPSGDTQAAPTRKRAPRSGRRRWLRLVLLLLNPLLVAAVGGILYLTGGRYVDTENAYIKADKVMLGAEVSGLISEVEVRENQHVDTGDVLFRIDDRSYRIALAEAEARLASVRDEIANLKAGYRQQEEELALARTNLAFAETELDRQTKLLAGHITSRSKYDDAKHTVDVERQSMRVIEQEMAKIRAQLGGDPDIEVTRHPLYLEMQAARDRAALDLERTVVRAPFVGVVSNKPEPGQQVAGSGAPNSPVMGIVADSGVWIEANFKETEVTHVRPGQPVTIHVDTYPDREWHGTIDSISQASGAEFSVIPPQNATGNWVKVVQRIPVRIAVDQDGDGPVLRAGMSTRVEIDTGHRRALPHFLQTALAWFGGATGAPTAAAQTTGAAEQP